jgi:alkylation response protein AidB-like acyl-CoA dehydrogenase
MASMSATDHAPAVAPGSREHAQRLVEQIRAAGPELEAAGRQAELDRALPPGIVKLLRDLGLFWLKTPNELGGTVLDPLDFCDVLEEVAYHDASAAWAVMVGNGTTGFLAGWLPDEGIREMFVPGEPLPIMAGQFVPRGTATRVDGGYRITGQWSFCSGIGHSNWVSGGFRTDDNDVRLFCIPKSETTVLDTWDVAGLQGTGSNDFSLSDHFVPAYRTMRTMGEPPKRGGPLHRQPARIFVGNELGPVVVGIARRALDDMREAAARSGGGMGRSALGDRPAFQKTFGQVDAQVHGASLLYREAVAVAWQRFLEGHIDEALIDVSMARMTHAVDSCADAVGELFRYGGGRVLSLDDPMQRHLRNLIAAAQHLMVSEENFELSGKALLADAEAGR